MRLDSSPVSESHHRFLLVIDWISLLASSLVCASLVSATLPTVDSTACLAAAAPLSPSNAQRMQAPSTPWFTLHGLIAMDKLFGLKKKQPAAKVESKEAQEAESQVAAAVAFGLPPQLASNQTYTEAIVHLNQANRIRLDESRDLHRAMVEYDTGLSERRPPPGGFLGRV
jgi:hypothetical protein